MDNTWAYEIGDVLLTYVTTRLLEKLHTEFPNLTVTSVADLNSLSQFPTVHIKTIGCPETGTDLEGESINAVDLAIQCDTYMNTTQYDTRKVSNEVANILKELRFKITTLPEFGNANDYFRVTFRGSRIIGANDKIGG